MNTFLALILLLTSTVTFSSEISVTESTSINIKNSKIVIASSVDTGTEVILKVNNLSCDEVTTDLNNSTSTTVNKNFELVVKMNYSPNNTRSELGKKVCNELGLGKLISIHTELVTLNDDIAYPVLDTSLNVRLETRESLTKYSGTYRVLRLKEISCESNRLGTSDKAHF